MTAEDAYYFFQSFFQSPDGKKYAKNPLVIAGESYAGHYIPAIAKRIADGNDGLADGDSSALIHLNLQRLAIGNGYYDSEVQFKWYAPMARRFKDLYGIEILKKTEYKKMKRGARRCIESIKQCNDDLENQLACQVGSVCEEETFFGVFFEKDICIYDMTQPVSSAPLTLV